jgi:hypothetical protein
MEEAKVLYPQLGLLANLGPWSKHHIPHHVVLLPLLLLSVSIHQSMTYCVT